MRERIWRKKYSETTDLGTTGRQSLLLREELVVHSQSLCGLRAGSEVV